MEDYELTIAAVQDYKNKACWMIGSNCDKCEAMYMQNGKQWCCFDTVIRFVEFDNQIYLKYFDERNTSKNDNRGY